MKAIKGPPEARRLTTYSRCSNWINEALDADLDYLCLHYDADQLTSIHWMYEYASWNAKQQLKLDENKMNLPWLYLTQFIKEIVVANSTLLIYESNIALWEFL